MPNNILTPLNYTIIARAHQRLRATLAMPMAVNTDFATEAAEKGSVITVKLSPTLGAIAVTPGAVHNDPAAADPPTANIALDQWYKTEFALTDKDEKEINAQRDFLPPHVEGAVDGLAEQVNSNILSHYTGIYGYVGAAGQTPFQDFAPPATNVYEGTRAIVEARKQLNKQRTPPQSRRFVMDPDAAGNALGLRAFQAAEEFGSDQVKRRGVIGSAFGFEQIIEELQIPTHTAGTITTGATAKAATGQPVGLKTVVFTTAATTGAVDLKKGDIVTIAGDLQTYVVTEAVAQPAAATDFNLKIEPGLQIALIGSEALSVKATHVVNMGFHRSAFAFANRPLAEGLGGRNPNITAMTDPLTGLSMRLEITRLSKMTKWEFDMLWGSALVEPRLATRVAG